MYQTSISDYTLIIKSMNKNIGKNINHIYLKSFKENNQGNLYNTNNSTSWGISGELICWNYLPKLCGRSDSLKGVLFSKSLGEKKTWILYFSLLTNLGVVNKYKELYIFFVNLDFNVSYIYYLLYLSTTRPRITSLITSHTILGMVALSR